MLYLGKLTEKTTRTAQAEGTGITYLVSCLGISSKIFQVNPADCWDQCYTDSKVLHVDWDGILDAFPAALGLASHVLSSASVVLPRSPRAGTPFPLPHSKEHDDFVCSAALRGVFRIRWSGTLLVRWWNADLQVGKDLSTRAGQVGRPSPFRGSSGCWGINVAGKPQPGSLRHPLLSPCSLLIWVWVCHLKPTIKGNIRCPATRAALDSVSKPLSKGISSVFIRLPLKAPEALSKG